MYSSVAPDPEVPVVHAGLLAVEVAKAWLASPGSAPEVMAIELGYCDWPETWDSISHSTV